MSTTSLILHTEQLFPNTLKIHLYISENIIKCLLRDFFFHIAYKCLDFSFLYGYKTNIDSQKRNLQIFYIMRCNKISKTGK